jgi:hypothetical protein
VAQELYAYLITYQAVRQHMHQAADAADIDPDRLSFTTALRAVRRFITTAATGQILTPVVDRVLSQIPEDQHDRGDRASPRVVKDRRACSPPRDTPSSRRPPPSTTPCKSSIPDQDDHDARLSSRHLG